MERKENRRFMDWNESSRSYDWQSEWRVDLFSTFVNELRQPNLFHKQLIKVTRYWTRKIFLCNLPIQIDVLEKNLNVLKTS